MILNKLIKNSSFALLGIIVLSCGPDQVGPNLKGASDDFDKNVQTLKEAKEWCEVAKYSPCENYLAVGSHDNHIYIYSVDPETHKYHLHAKDGRNSSWINAIDWTLDSKEVRTTSGDYTTLYFNVETKEADPHGSETAADKSWASSNIKYGKDRDGVKPHGITIYEVEPDGTTGGA